MPNMTLMAGNFTLESKFSKEIIHQLIMKMILMNLEIKCHNSKENSLTIKFSFMNRKHFMESWNLKIKQNFIKFNLMTVFIELFQEEFLLQKQSNNSLMVNLIFKMIQKVSLRWLIYKTEKQYIKTIIVRKLSKCVPYNTFLTTKMRRYNTFCHLLKGAHYLDMAVPYYFSCI